MSAHPSASTSGGAERDQGKQEVQAGLHDEGEPRRDENHAAQCGMPVSLGVLLAVPGVESGGLVPVVLIIFVYNLFGTLQDVATGALFEARSIFLCATLLGVVPLALLYWLPPVSEKGKRAAESAVPQNPS